MTALNSFSSQQVCLLLCCLKSILHMLLLHRLSTKEFRLTVSLQVVACCIAWWAHLLLSIYCCLLQWLTPGRMARLSCKCWLVTCCGSLRAFVQVLGLMNQPFAFKWNLEALKLCKALYWTQCTLYWLLCIDWVAYNVSFAWFINDNTTVILLMCLRMQSSRGAGSSNVASCPAAGYREI